MSSLVDKFHISLLFHSKPPLKPSSRPFEEALALRLRSLLPIPSHPLPVSLTWLVRAVRLLALTLAGAAALFSDPSLPAPDHDALSAHLDASVLLLDACNAVSAEVVRLEHRLLPLRLALLLLSYEDCDDDDNGGAPMPPTEERVRRARKVINEWESTHGREVGRSAAEMIRRMTPDEPPRGTRSAVLRATYAVEAISRLVMAAAVAVLGRGEATLLGEVRVSGEWPWAEDFNEVAATVSGQARAAPPGELEAVEASVRKLTAVIDGEEKGERMERLGTAVAAVERATEEFAEALDGLRDSVNGAFHAAMGTRNAVLNMLRSRARRCT